MAMEPNLALELVKHGVSLLLLDVPQYTLLGIDTQIFTTGPNFKGIKMIPPGQHFLYYSSSCRDGKDFSPMIGFFLDTASSEVIVRKWDCQGEVLVKVSEEEEERYSHAVRSFDFDQHLGPYDLHQYGEWKHLSDYITKTVFERIEPIGGEITITSESDLVTNGHKSAKEKYLDEQLGTGKFSRSVDKFQKRGCYYTPIPRVVKRKGINMEELTSLNLDKTELLESIMINDYSGTEDLLLGELQFAYIAFLMAQSLEAFMQWKSLLTLLFGCIEAPFRTRSHLFTKFIKVLYYQVRYVFRKDRGDTIGAGTGVSVLFDDSWFGADSFLYKLCKDFFMLIEDASVVDGDLLSWTKKLKELFERCVGWEFQHKTAIEDDELAPVIVLLDEEPDSCSSMME